MVSLCVNHLKEALILWGGGRSGDIVLGKAEIITLKVAIEHRRRGQLSLTSECRVFNVILFSFFEVGLEASGEMKV